MRGVLTFCQPFGMMQHGALSGSNLEGPGNWSAAYAEHQQPSSVPWCSAAPTMPKPSRHPHPPPLYSSDSTCMPCASWAQGAPLSDSRYLTQSLLAALGFTSGSESAVCMGEMTSSLSEPPELLQLVVASSPSEHESLASCKQRQSKVQLTPNLPVQYDALQLGMSAELRLYSAPHAGAERQSSRLMARVLRRSQREPT
jgi:hypothetical protein